MSRSSLYLRDFAVLELADKHFDWKDYDKLLNQLRRTAVQRFRQSM